MTQGSAAARPGSIIGLDFSGARRPGRALWLAAARPAGGMLAVDSVQPAAALPGAGTERSTVYAAVRRHLLAAAPAVVGCDFPFSLPERLLGGLDWPAFAAGFAARFADAEAFREVCRRAHRAGELRRRTDRAAKTPFAAYNLRLYRQTFHGIRDLLAPLAGQASVAVAGVAARPGATLILAECCPASTLKAAGLYRPYKGAGAAAAAGRHAIAAALPDLGVRTSPETACLLTAQPGGDALDSVLAALGAWRAWQTPGFPAPADALEAREARVFY